jgi:FKBP-type peptidyl-prolyl cis-trans isomerase 2
MTEIIRVHFMQRVSKTPYCAFAVALLCAVSACADEATTTTIEAGSVVSLRYTVSLPDGKVVHSNVNSDPIRYKQGDGKLLPALEAALTGLAAGDETSVTLPPENTYPVNKDAFQSVPVDSIPEDMRHVDAVFRPMGSRGSVRVAKINGNTAVLDFNHPLAGKTLTYDITILAVE